MILQSLPANTSKKVIVRCLLLACLLAMKSAFAQVPVISSFAPLSAAPGSEITITGTFNSTAGNNMVFFGGTKGNVISATSSSLTVTVPHGATHAALQVLNITNGLSAKSTQYFLPTFTPGKPALHKTDFTLSSHLPVGFRAFDVVTADLNEDGKPDFIQTNSVGGYNYFAISYNTSTPSNISMAPREHITATGSSNFGRPATGDLDGDGKPDIVLPSTGTDEIIIYKNSGNSVNRFSTFNQFATDDNPSSVAIGDIDGDGRNDIVVAYANHANVSIFLNTSTQPGNISFAAKSDLSAGVNRSEQIELADLNNDGKPEIVFPHATWYSFFYVKNNSNPGSINFDSGIEVEIASAGNNNINQISLGDIDGDGKIDLAMATNNFTSPYVAIFRNTSPDGGAIGFDAKKEIPLPMQQSSLTLGDLNGDGKPDLMVGYGASFAETPLLRFGLLQNTTVGSTINFTQVSEFEAETFPWQSVIVDVDGDGRPDMISTNLNTTTWSIYRNSLQFPPAITSFSPVKAIPGSTITITGTGFNTLPANNVVFFGATKATVTTASETSLTVTVPAGATYSPISVLNTFNSLTGYSSGLFLPAFSPSKTDLESTDFISQGDLAAGGSSLYGLVSRDLNGDSKPDLVGTDNVGNAVRIYPNSTAGSDISFITPILVDLADYPSPRYPATGDLDGDGKPEVIVPSYGSNKVVVLRNTTASGTLSFAAPVDFPTGVTPNSAATGDLDGDGKTDIAVANYGVSASYNALVSVLRNTSTGPGVISFAPKVDVSESGTYQTVAVFIADLDGDSKPDLITQSQSSVSPGVDWLSIYKNTSTHGTISFASRINLDVRGRIPWSASLADMNNDNKPDLLISDADASIFSIYLNTSSGSISFAAPRVISTGAPQKSISVGDINGDGKPDVVVSNLNPKTPGQQDHYVSVFTNITGAGEITFAPKIDLATSGAFSHVNILADFDGDSRPDILSGNSDNQTITVLRNILNTPPTVQASALVFTRQSTASSKLSWTNGNGQKRAVFVKQDETGIPLPVDGTDYTANAQFGTGSQIGTSGWYCVYNGTGSSVTVTGLSSLTYRAMVVELNDNSLSNAAKYQTASATGNPFNFIPASSITSISRMDASPSNVATVRYDVQLSTAVTGLTAANFTLVSTGITGASITGISGSGTAYTVTANTGTGDGTLELRIMSDTGLDRFFTNTLPFAGETYTIDRTGQALSTVSIASSGTNTAKAKPGDIVTLSITSAEPISAPAVTIANQNAVVSGSGAAWNATYTMLAGDAEGVIPFTIAFSDILGNAGTSVSATTNSSSITFDKTTPSLTAVTILSNNNSTSKAKTGDEISLSFTSSEPLLNVSADIAGAAATISGSGTSWVVKHITTAADPEGALSFSISYTDISGNPGSVVQAGTSSTVYLDKTAPLLSSVSMVSNNSNPAKAGRGNFITLSFTSSEAIRTPAVNIAGQILTANNSGGNTWVAKYPVTSSSPAGNVQFSINSEDIAGNVLPEVRGTTDNSTIYIEQPSSIASLASLELSNGTLSSPFDPANLSYTTSVLDNSIVLTPLATDPAASVSVNGATALRGASANVSLTPGNNTATIQVISPDASVTNTYTLVITRIGPANQAPTIDAINNLKVCPSTATQVIPLSGIGPGPETDQLTTLSVSSTNPGLFNSLNIVQGNVGNGIISYGLKNGVSGSSIITVTVKDNGGTENGGVDETKRTFTLTVEAPFTTTINNSTLEALSKGSTTSLTASGGVSYSWESETAIINDQNSAVLTVRPSETTTYTVTATNASGCISKASITVNVADDGLALDGKNVVTPNGDGRNDKFIIQNIDMYPNNRLVIFDRSGREIYSKNGYKNEWEGTFEGKPLSEGTYYYVVYLKEDLRPLRGYISIVN